MKKSFISLIAFSLFVLSGCFPGVTEMESSCGNLRGEYDTVHREYNNKKVAASEKEEACEDYPVQWQNASKKGGSQTELDGIVAEHNACLAEAERLNDIYEEVKVRFTALEVRLARCEELGTES